MTLIKVVKRGLVALALSFLLSFEKKERERILRERLRRSEDRSRIDS
jgi:hypothetical protein